MKFLENLALASIAVFAPVHTMMAAVVALIFMDLITGIIASKKQGRKVTSSGIKRTIGKVFLYEVAIAAGYLAEHYLIGDAFPVSKLISSLIGITELKSILENLDVISGNDLFKILISKVTQQREDIEKK